MDPTVVPDLRELLSPHLRTLELRRSAMSTTAGALGLAVALINQELAVRMTFSLDPAKSQGSRRSWRVIGHQ